MSLIPCDSSPSPHVQRGHRMAFCLSIVGVWLRGVVRIGKHGVQRGYPSFRHEAIALPSLQRRKKKSIAGAREGAAAAVQRNERGRPARRRSASAQGTRAAVPRSPAFINSLEVPRRLFSLNVRLSSAV